MKLSGTNHDAKLSVLIQEYYKKGLTDADIELLNLLDKQDVLFYVDTMNKREHASYSSRTNFDANDVKNIKVKTILFVNKAHNIIETATT